MVRLKAQLRGGGDARLLLRGVASALPRDQGAADAEERSRVLADDGEWCEGASCGGVVGSSVRPARVVLRAERQCPGAALEGGGGGQPLDELALPVIGFYEIDMRSG